MKKKEPAPVEVKGAKGKKKSDEKELKNKKKLEPTSMALPAASASSIILEEVIPLLPSAVALQRTGLP